MKKWIMSITKQGWVLILIFCVFIIMVCYKPTQIPAPWFDEGWTLSVARNWIEKGIYARLLEDRPVSYVGMGWSFPVTVPVGISFRLFGIGVFQGRLPNILLTVGSLWMLYCFSKRLYSERIGITSLLVILFASTVPHIIVMGRQAVAEIPMIFFLILGFAGFYYALSRSNWFLLLPVISWGISITCKQHPLPFLSFAFFVCGFAALLSKKYQILLKVLIVWVGSLIVYFSLVWIESWLTKDLYPYGSPMKGLYEVTAFVMNSKVRLDTLRGFVIFGLPTLIGLCYGLRDILRQSKEKNDTWFFVNMYYLAFNISWLFWFVSFSIGWPRYFFPVAFFSSVYLALMLDRFTSHFDIKFLAANIGGDLRKFRLSWTSTKALVAIFFIVDGIVFSYSYLSILSKTANNSAYDVAEYINHNTKEGSVVETYDSELVFLLNRPVHFPPDQIQVELNRRLDLDPDTPVDYDPLAAAPDYIVVGPFSRLWRLYDSVIESGLYTSSFSESGYEVYNRVDRLK